MFDCLFMCIYSVVQLLSCIWLFVTPWTAVYQASLSSPIIRSLLKFMSIDLVILSNHFILCHLLLLLPSVFPSIRVFSNKLGLHIRWPKYLSFSLTSVLPMNIQGWFPLRLTGLILLLSKGVSGVFSSTTIQKHQFFSAQTFLWYNSHIRTMTTGKTIALIIQNFVGKMIPLLFNRLSGFVIAFFPRSKCLLISWLQSLSTVILDPKKNLSLCPLYPHLFTMKWWDWMLWS